MSVAIDDDREKRPDKKKGAAGNGRRMPEPQALVETLQAALQREGIAPSSAPQLANHILRLVREYDGADPPFQHTPSTVIEDTPSAADDSEQRQNIHAVNSDSQSNDTSGNPSNRRRSSVSDAIAEFFTTRRIEGEVRMVRPQAVPFEIVSKDTIARALFGVLVNKWAAQLSYLVWWIGYIVGGLCICEVIDGGWVWVSFLMVPPSIITFGMFNIKLCQKIVRNFTSLYIIANCAALTVFLSLALADRRAFVVVCAFPCLMAAGFTDALPAYFRSVATKQFYFNMIVGVTFYQSMLFFNFARFPDRTFTLGRVTTTASTLASSCLFNLLLFGMRNVVMHFRHPECLVAIACRVENVKVTETVAKTEKAMGLQRKKLSTASTTSKGGVTRVLPHG